jgi:hypothetical protein
MAGRKCAFSILENGAVLYGCNRGFIKKIMSLKVYEFIKNVSSLKVESFYRLYFTHNIDY